MSLLSKRMICVIAALAVMTSLLGFVGAEKSYAAGKIHLKKTSVSVQVKKTYQQQLIDKKGKKIKATKVTWKSANTKVAKISKAGKVTAVWPGTAKMTAKYKGKTYKFTVKVPAVVGHLNKTSVKVNKGAMYQLSLLNKSNKAFSATAVKWASSNSSVAKISSTGLITAVKPGTAKMTAKYYGKTYTCTVTVPKIWFSVSTLNMMQQDETVITVMVDDSIESISKKKDKDFISANWTDDASSRYDDSTWMCTMKIKAYDEGTETLTVYDKNNESICNTLKIVIKPLINKWIAFNAFTVKVGQTIGVTVSTGSGGDPTWYNYDSDIVELEWGDWADNHKDCTLYITGVKAGKALIEVYDVHDPTVYSDVLVTVTN